MVLEAPLGGRRRPGSIFEGLGPRGLEQVLATWRSDPRIWGQIVLDVHEPAKSAACAPVPAEVEAPVLAALRARGIEQLYTHQVEAFALATAGTDVVVATPTASGKSLCYNLPVLQRLAREPAACALYLFPTKALARDQEENLRGWLEAAGLGGGAVAYDGDTPGDARRAARQRAGVVLTNPDMLHAGILPHHAGWARVFAQLRYVVIDELHTYRGVFGSHLANVLRRLRRIASFHGSQPVFVFTSATIGNPEEHATRMLGRPVRLVSESGAASSPRQVLLYNPPVVNAELGIRQSYLKASVRLTADLVRAGVPTLVFGQSRNSVEVMLKYLRDRLAPEIPEERIVAYRGGYLPKTRRRIESGLRQGEIACVVATNALELGIDIGGLDAVVCAGYPGSMAALWQRWGRAGRRGDLCAAVLVTSSSPLDQFFALDPELLIGAPIEHARIDPDHVEILVQHLKCAAFELPMATAEGFGDLPVEGVQAALAFLAEHGLVHARDDQSGGSPVYHWASEAYPANQVSLRSLGWENVVVIDVERQDALGEMDWRSAHTMLHEHAIYQHQARQFQVERLDFENHKAYVREVEPDYYTTAMTQTSVTVLDEAERAVLRAAAPRPALRAALGEVNVVEKVVGFKKIKFHTHENTGYGEVHLPEMEMQTVAVWWTFARELVAAMPAPRAVVIDALRSFGNALHTVSAIGLMIDPHDLGVTLGPGPEASAGLGEGTEADFDPTLFVFDRTPGGIGLAARIYDEREEVLVRAAELVERCPCRDGCPSCIGPSAGVHEHSRRALLIALLRGRLAVRSRPVEVAPFG